MSFKSIYDVCVKLYTGLRPIIFPLLIAATVYLAYVMFSTKFSLESKNDQNLIKIDNIEKSQTKQSTQTDKEFGDVKARITETKADLKSDIDDVKIQIKDSNSMIFDIWKSQVAKVTTSSDAEKVDIIEKKVVLEKKYGKKMKSVQLEKPEPETDQ